MKNRYEEMIGQMQTLLYEEAELLEGIEKNTQNAKELSALVEKHESCIHFMQEAYEMYNAVNEKLVKIAENEIVYYPPTEFGISSFEQLEKYHQMIRFRK